MKISNKLNKSATVFALLIILFSSCKEVEIVQPDYEALLLSGTWTFSEEVNLDPVNAAVVNSILVNSTLTFNNGGAVISTFFGFDGTNTWEFNAGKTTIIIDKGLVSEDEWTIVSLTATEFIYSDDDDNDEGGEAIPFSLTDGKPLELKFVHL